MDPIGFSSDVPLTDEARKLFFDFSKASTRSISNQTLSDTDACERNPFDAD